MSKRPTWDDVFRNQQWGRYPNEMAVREVVAARKKIGGFNPHATDLGCGAGAHTLMLLQEGFEVTAIDSSEEALKQAWEHCGGRGTSHPVHFVEHDYIKAPATTGTADLILDWLSLTHATPSVTKKVAKATLKLLPKDTFGVYILGLFGDATDKEIFTDRPKCTCYCRYEARDFGYAIAGKTANFRMEAMSYTRKGVLVELYCLVFTVNDPENPPNPE